MSLETGLTPLENNVAIYMKLTEFTFHSAVELLGIYGSDIITHGRNEGKMLPIATLLVMAKYWKAKCPSVEDCPSTQCCGVLKSKTYGAN